MKFEVLKRNNLKRNIIIGVFVVLIISAVVLNFTRAKYRSTASVPIVNSTVNYKVYDLKVLAMYQENEAGEYVSIDVMPSSGYVINESESYCTVDGINKDNNAKLYTNDNGEHVIANLQKKSKCYLYFDAEPSLTSDEVLAKLNLYVSSGTPDFSNTSCTNGTNNGRNCDEETVGIYSAEDDDGITYYFRGNVENNYVYFAGFYWRIIRINGTGTIRIIYDGTSPHANGVSSEDRQISLSTFNDYSTDNMYVGFMYESNVLHGLTTSSKVKKVLDNWYQTRLASYSNYISYEDGFCGDRTLSSGTGLGTVETSYAPYRRLTWDTDRTFKCIDSTDLYTVSSSNKGNKALVYPIGLITVDEVIYAGNAYYGSNYSFYLNTEQNYWTMSPAYYSTRSNQAGVLIMNGSSLNWHDVTNSYGVRPVINLKADTQFTGTGTISDPFVLL